MPLPYASWPATTRRVPRTVGEEILPGSIGASGGTWVTQTVAWFSNFTLRVRNAGELGVVNAGQVYPLELLIAAQSSAAGQRLFLLDASNPQASPTLIGDTTNGVVLPPIGTVNTIEYDPTDPRHLRVVASNGVVFLSIDRLTMASPATAGRHHPAVVDDVREVGSSNVNHGATSFGLFVQPSRKDLVFAGPRMMLATFPDETRVVHPSDIRRTTSADALDERFRTLLAGMQEEHHLRPARVHTVGPLPDQCNSLDRNFHVVMYAPGGVADATNGELTLYYEGLNSSAHPLMNPSPGFAPVRAGESSTLSTIGRRARPNAPDILPLKAYRLSNDRSSELYNVFVSDPFVVTYEERDESGVRNADARPREARRRTAGLF